MFKEQLKEMDKFRNIPEIITKLEDPSLSMAEQLAHLQTAGIEYSSNAITDAKSKKISLKNKGLQTMISQLNNISFDIKMKFAPLTSVPCEQSFS